MCGKPKNSCDSFLLWYLLYCGGLDWASTISEGCLYFYAKGGPLLIPLPLSFWEWAPGRAQSCPPEAGEPWGCTYTTQDGQEGTPLKSATGTWSPACFTDEFAEVQRRQVTHPRTGADQQPSLPHSSSLLTGSGEDAVPLLTLAAISASRSSSFLPTLFCFLGVFFWPRKP